MVIALCPGPSTWLCLVEGVFGTCDCWGNWLYMQIYTCLRFLVTPLWCLVSLVPAASGKHMRRVQLSSGAWISFTALDISIHPEHPRTHSGWWASDVEVGYVHPIWSCPHSHHLQNSFGANLHSRTGGTFSPGLKLRPRRCRLCCDRHHTPHRPHGLGTNVVSYTTRVPVVVQRSTQVMEATNKKDEYDSFDILSSQDDPEPPTDHSK